MLTGVPTVTCSGCRSASTRENRALPPFGSGTIGTLAARVERTRVASLLALAPCGTYICALAPPARPLICKVAGPRSRRVRLPSLKRQFMEPMRWLSARASVGVRGRGGGAGLGARFAINGAERPVVLSVRQCAWLASGFAGVLGGPTASSGCTDRYRPGIQEPCGVSADLPHSRIPSQGPRRGQRPFLARRRAVPS